MGSLAIWGPQNTPRVRQPPESWLHLGGIWVETGGFLADPFPREVPTKQMAHMDHHSRLPSYFLSPETRGRIMLTTCKHHFASILPEAVVEMIQLGRAQNHGGYLGATLGSITPDILKLSV